MRSAQERAKKEINDLVCRLHEVSATQGALVFASLTLLWKTHRGDHPDYEAVARKLVELGSRQQWMDCRGTDDGSLLMAFRALDLKEK